MNLDSSPATVPETRAWVGLTCAYCLVLLARAAAGTRTSSAPAGSILEIKCKSCKRMNYVVVTPH